MEEEAGDEGMEHLTTGALDVEEETVRIQNSRQGVAVVGRRQTLCAYFEN